MPEMLKIGAGIKSENGVEYKVERFIGSGGQGEVYEVSSSEGKKALKMLNKMASTERQKAIISDLVLNGAPSKNFLWPEDTITDGPNGSFGYVMKLRPKEYKGIPDLFNQKINPYTHTLIKAIFNMATEYELLHSRGYSYKDINEKNIFFHPETGEVLICDNDNVSVNAANDSGVDGTMRYMAPEIVCNRAKPSRNTDLYSLATLIFMMLYITHPLEGANEYKIHSLDAIAQKKLYGTHPVYIFDPNNKENQPVPGYHINALAFKDFYPEFVSKTFETAFTVGLLHPEKRIVERQWKDMCVKLLDCLMVCPHCKAELFYDKEGYTLGTHSTCWSCGYQLTERPFLKIGKNKVMVQSGRELKSHHINNNYDIETTVGTIVSNPKNPSLLGLRNDSNDTWIYIKPDGTQVMLPPGRSGALTKGVKINCGKTICEL